MDRRVRAQPGIESRIDRAIRKQLDNPPTWQAESAAHQNTSVATRMNHMDRAIKSGVHQEGDVDIAGREDPANPIGVATVDNREATAQHDRPVRTDRERGYQAIRSGAGIEA